MFRTMKLKIPTFILGFLLVSNFSIASGTYNVGTGQTYTTFKSAMDAVNTGTISGTLIFQIAANCNETNTVILNASGSGSANYSSILIYPTGAPRTIACTFSNDVFRLNGADNVTVDGRVNQTGSSEGLIIENANTGFISVLSFINDATNNMIKYCTIKGSNSSFSGVVQFGTASVGGNDNNTIDHCTITKSGSNIPRWLIYSDGTTGYENSANSITNCNFTEFTRDGIYLRNYTTNWSITGNSFYGVTSLTPISNSSFISINSGSDYIILTNYFGGQSSQCALNTGLPYTVNTSIYAFYGINFSATSLPGTTNTICSNVFQNISFETTTNSSFSSPAFAFVNISSTTSNANFIIGANGNGNTIGATSGTGSLTFIDNSSIGISMAIVNKASGTGNIDFSYNTIGSINHTGTSTLGNFITLNVGAGTGSATFSNNTIGNSDANNISDPISRSGAGNYLGLRYLGTGIVSVTNNIIQNFSFLSNTNSSSCYSFYVQNASSATINSNSIKNINYARSGVFTPIYISIAGLITVNSNLISEIIASNTGVIFTGLNLISSADNITVNSNIIGSSNTNNISVAGNSFSKGIFITIPINKTASLDGNTVQEMSFTNTGTSTQVMLIYVTGSGNSSVINSIVKNCTSAGTSTNTGGALNGIRIGVTSSSSVVEGNVISNLSLSNNSTSSLKISGINHLTGGTATAIINIKRNKVTGLTNLSPTSGDIYGISNFGASTSINTENNIVMISNSSNTNPIRVEGIYESVNAPSTIYHNTIYISGNFPGVTVANSHALYNLSTVSTKILKNNVFKNSRTGGTGFHFALEITTTGNATVDYNYVESTSSVVKWGASSTSFATWVTTHTNEKTGSISIDGNGKVTAGETGTVKDMGVDLMTGSIVTIDFYGNARDIQPWRGAIEPPVVLPIELLFFEGEKIDRKNELKWSTLSELNFDYFTLEKSVDGYNFEWLTNLEGNGNSSSISNYEYEDLEVQNVINYYKLWMTDFDGKKKEIGIVSINNREKEKIINKKYNLLGQEIDDDYVGMIIILYTDGTTLKTFSK